MYCNSTVLLYICKLNTKQKEASMLKNISQGEHNWGKCVDGYKAQSMHLCNVMYIVGNKKELD